MSKPAFEDIFVFSGRRNRKSYILYMIGMVALAVVVYGIAALLAAATHVWAILVLAWLVMIPLAISGWAVMSQRCRDFGWTGWAVLLTLIPAVGWIFALAILFIPGNVGPNRYGPDPIPNHLNDWTERAPIA